MVRGNWQQRVERNQRRQNEAKEKKRKSGEKRVFKQMSQALLSMLENSVTDIVRRRDKAISIHVWVDSLPDDPGVSRNAILQDAPEEKGSVKRRNRSGSTASADSASGRKKVHPRSKETARDLANDDHDAAPLCRSDFFTRACQQNKKSGKKSSCRCVHFNKQSKTLASVLLGDSKNKKSEADVAAADEANPTGREEASPDMHKTTMDMLFHLEVVMDQASIASSTLNELLSAELSRKACPIAGIVYCSVDDCLIFDRYQNGVLPSHGLDSDTEGKLEGGTSNGKGQDTSVAAGSNESGDLVYLPGTVLDHMLTFLPLSSIVASTGVCKHWNAEIGKSAGYLWKVLLKRRNWPVPIINDDDNNASTNDDTDVASSSTYADEEPQPIYGIYRNAFTATYGVVRDLNSLSIAATSILSRKSTEQKECCFRPFASHQNSPKHLSKCAALKVWDDKRILAAYSADCSLRLYSCVPKGDGESYCKQIVEQTLDLCKSTRKRTCAIAAVDLDDSWIGCMMVVHNLIHETESSLLVLVQRDEFLQVGDDLDSRQALQVIDVSEAVRNYFMTCEEAGDGLLQLFDFLTNYGEPEDVSVVASDTIASLGYGRFLIEVAISIPNYDEDHDNGDDDSIQRTIMRKLVVFSASAQSIVWVGDSHPEGAGDAVLSDHKSVAVLSNKMELPQDDWSEYRFLVINHTQAISMGHVEAKTFQHLPLTTVSFAVDGAHQMQMDSTWERSAETRQSLTMGDHVVVSDNFSRLHHEETLEYKSVVSILPITAIDHNDEQKAIALNGNVVVQQLIAFDERHVVAMCIQRPPPDAVDNLDGHWFGPDQTADKSIVAVLIHIAAGREIERVTVVHHMGQYTEDAPEPRTEVVAYDGQVGLALDWMGVVMAGQRTRDVIAANARDYHESGKATKKKKKKGLRKSGAKKDGFARGMSLRG